MRELTTPLHVARHILMTDKAFLLFVEIPRVAGGFYRLVRNTVHVAANGVNWQACAMDIVLPEEDAEGTLGSSRLVLPNVSRIPMAAVERDGELIGQIASVWLQHTDTLPAFVPSLRWTSKVLAAVATEKVMQLECGHPAGIYDVPSRRFNRRDFPQMLPLGVR